MTDVQLFLSGTPVPNVGPFDPTPKPMPMPTSGVGGATQTPMPATGQAEPMPE